jgi:hypothetical protein
MHTGSLVSSFSEARHQSYIDGLAALGTRPYFLGTDGRVLSHSIEPWAYGNVSISKEDEKEEISKLHVISWQNADIYSRDGEGFRSLLAELYLLQRRHGRIRGTGLDALPKSRKIIGASQIIFKELLVPYVATLRARPDAMEPIRRSIETFIRRVNLFFRTSILNIFRPVASSLESGHLN